jgi:signal transduction histidine kinase
MRKTILQHSKRKYDQRKNELLYGRAYIFGLIILFTFIIARIMSLILPIGVIPFYTDVTFSCVLSTALLVIIVGKYKVSINLMISATALMYVSLVFHLYIIILFNDVSTTDVAKLAHFITLPVFALIIPFSFRQIVPVAIMTPLFYLIFISNSSRNSDLPYEILILAVTSFVSVLNILFNERNLKRDILKEQSLLIERKILEDHINKRSQTVETQAQQIKELALEITHAESRERQNIATRIHDNLQQILAATKLQVGLVKRRVKEEKNITSLGEIESLLTQSIDISRSLSMELAPQILFESGHGPAFFWLARWMETHHNLETKIIVDENVTIASDDMKSFLFQTARELLFNIVKHANTSEATLELSKPSENSVQLKISDEGSGFNSENFHKNPKILNHFGLANIKRRSKLLGGNFTIKSDDNTGTVVTIALPMNILLE